MGYLRLNYKKNREHLSSFSLKRFILNCRRQAEIKTKSTVQTPFFEKSAEMQLPNSNIPRRARTTRYSNKKAQDLLNLVLFCCVAFSYYFGGSLIRNSYKRNCSSCILLIVSLITSKILLNSEKLKSLKLGRSLQIASAKCFLDKP